MKMGRKEQGGKYEGSAIDRIDYLWEEIGQDERKCYKDISRRGKCEIKAGMMNSV